MSEYHDELLDHNYDGIQEYDNPMPAWWKALFVITIIWSVIYVAGIYLGYFGTYGVDLKDGMAELETARQAHAAAQPEIKVDDALFTARLEDKDALAVGQKVYTANCAACHGDKGQGMIGPNLTDQYWLHGAKNTEVYTTIANGVLDKGMPAWGAVISQQEAINVTAYLFTLRGTNPEGAKAPQGEKVE